MRRPVAVAIAVGGMVGATCRWGLLEIWPAGHDFPWPIFVVNVVGSFVVGVALAEESLHPASAVNATGSFALGIIAHGSAFVATVLGTGLLGAYTTFSSFARDAVALWERERRSAAIGYVTTSVVVCIAAARLGLALVD